jgi:hypothetical protein
MAVGRRSGGVAGCARTSRSNNCWLRRFMALSWPNLFRALKAAIGFGKQTLGGLANLPRRRRRGKKALGARLRG